jgi:hypothetical protein
MLFLLFFLTVLFIPGYLVAVLLGTREYRFLVALTLSLFYFIVLSSLSAELEFGMSEFTAMYGVTVVAMLGFVLLRSRKGIITNHGFSTLIFSETLAMSSVLFIIVGVATYHLAFGYYDEVPSDLYQHLVYTQRGMQQISSGFQDDFSRILALKGSGDYWYQLINWVALVSGSSRFELYPFVLVGDAIIFAIAVALCADRLFRALHFTPAQHQIAVLLAVFFVFTQMGINVFSYVRYYSYAPTMVNFCVYFTGLVCALDIFEKQGDSIRSVTLIAIAVFTSYFIHDQEALFIILSCLLLLVWGCLALILERRTLSFRKILWPLAILLLVVAGGVMAYLYVRFDRELRPLTHNHIIPLPFTIPLFGQPHILNPIYQFIQVITSWGVAIYLLSLLHLKKLSNQPFFILAMLSPIITVFNPVFVDIFIRLQETTVLWRLCYFIPLHFIAAALCIILWQCARRSSFPKQSICSIALLGIFLLLLPSIGPVKVNAYARTTLERVGTANRVEYWQDMIEFLGTLENNYDILTDPISGYLISAFTPHRTYQYKFLPNQTYYNRPFLFDDYSQFPLSKYQGKLLVVNNRNGDPSKTGESSNHWHKDVLRLSDYYSAALVDHVDTNPDRFEMMWSRDRISIYLIR